MAIQYVARVQRTGQPEVQYRGELGAVRRKATKKLRQHVAKTAMRFRAAAEEGRLDPLMVALLQAHTTIGQDSWGGAVRYKGRLADGDIAASYAVFVD